MVDLNNAITEFLKFMGWAQYYDGYDKKYQFYTSRFRAYKTKKNFLTI